MFGSIAGGSNRENSIMFDTKRVIGSIPKNRTLLFPVTGLKKKDILIGIWTVVRIWRTLAAKQLEL